MLAKFSVVESFNNQSTPMLPKIAVNDHSLTLIVKVQKDSYYLFYILPANIINLFIKRTMIIYHFSPLYLLGNLFIKVLRYIDYRRNILWVNPRII